MPTPVQSKDAITPEERAAAMADYQAILADSAYATSPLRVYIIPMDRVQNTKHAPDPSAPQGSKERFEWWSSTLTVKPYMETAGRVVEAQADTARPLIAIRTFLNNTPEPREFQYRGEEFVVPANHAKAVLVRWNRLGAGATELQPDTGGRWYEQTFEATEAIRTGGGGADKTHPVANAETSVLGRVLGFAGYGNLPGSSLSPAETMVETPQDGDKDESAAGAPTTTTAKPTTAPRTRAPRSTAVDVPELDIVELEAVNDHARAISAMETVAELKAYGATVSQDKALTERMIAYLQSSYTGRMVELKARDKAASVAEAAAAEAPVSDEAPDAAA